MRDRAAALHALPLEPDIVLLQVCSNDYRRTPVLFSWRGEFYWLEAHTEPWGPPRRGRNRWPVDCE